MNILKEALKNVSSDDTKLELEHKIKEIEMILNDHLLNRTPNFKFKAD